MRVLFIFAVIVLCIFISIVLFGCGSSKQGTIVREPDTVIIVVDSQDKPVIVQEEKSDDSESSDAAEEGKDEDDTPVDKKKSRIEKIREMRENR